MALITCPECGNQVSDKATACPSCGCPVDAGGFNKKHCESGVFRITKEGSGTTIRFNSSSADYVYLECSKCRSVYEFKRDYFDEVDESGCASPIQIECPNCMPESEKQKPVDSTADDKAQQEEEEGVSYAFIGMLLMIVAMMLAQILPPLGYLLFIIGMASVCFHCFNRLRAAVKSAGEEREIAPVSGDVLHEQLEKMEQRSRAYAPKYNYYKYTCPMCGGHRIKTIGTGRKLASAATLGVAGRSLGKNYQCDDCNYRW